MPCQRSAQADEVGQTADVWVSVFVALDAARNAQARARVGGLAEPTHREAARVFRDAVELHERYARLDDETADTKDARRH